MQKEWQLPEPVNVKMNVALSIRGSRGTSIVLPKDDAEWKAYKADPTKVVLSGDRYMFTSGGYSKNGIKQAGMLCTGDKDLLEKLSWFSGQIQLHPITDKEFRLWITNPNNLPYIQNSLTGTKDQIKKEKEFIYIDSDEKEVELFMQKRNSEKNFAKWSKELDEQEIKTIKESVKPIPEPKPVSKPKAKSRKKPTNSKLDEMF